MWEVVVMPVTGRAEMDFEAGLLVASLVLVDLVEVDLKEFGLRPFFVLVLKGLATGARFGSPLVVDGFAGGRFWEGSAEEARAAAVHAIARKKSAAARR